MKKILLTHAYFLRLDPKQWMTSQPYPPLGTLYAAAVLRDLGFPLVFHDAMFDSGVQETREILRATRPDIFVIYDDGFNYLTKMCLENMREAAFGMIRAAKELGCTVIVSSSDSTDRRAFYLDAGADFIILGEGEQTLIELTANLGAGNDDAAAIRGLAYKKEGGIVITAKREVMTNLDEIPFPAWELLDIDPYRKMWMKSAGYFSINMVTTRGCPFKCNWCAKPIYGNRYNSRSPGNVAAELKMLKQRFNIDHVWFSDDIFGLKPGWVAGFADIVQKESLAVRFKMQGRVDLLLKDQTVRDLARAGCEKVWMGAESGSQKILDAMDKGTTVEQIYGAAELLKTHGIKPCFFIQFGYPDETKKDIRQTIRMINQLLPYELGISVSYPLPGTVFHERVKDQLKLKTNWAHSDELALMFRNTYQPAFYRRLHRYVHKTYRMHLAIAHCRQLFNLHFGKKLFHLRKALAAFYYLPAAWLDQIRLKQLEKPIPDASL